MTHCPLFLSIPSFSNADRAILNRRQFWHVWQATPGQPDFFLTQSPWHRTFGKYLSSFHWIILEIKLGEEGSTVLPVRKAWSSLVSVLVGLSHCGKTSRVNETRVSPSHPSSQCLPGMWCSSFYVTPSGLNLGHLFKCRCLQNGPLLGQKKS